MIRSPKVRSRTLLLGKSLAISASSCFKRGSHSCRSGTTCTMMLRGCVSTIRLSSWWNQSVTWVVPTFFPMNPISVGEYCTRSQMLGSTTAVRVNSTVERRSWLRPRLTVNSVSRLESMVLKGRGGPFSFVGATPSVATAANGSATCPGTTGGSATGPAGLAASGDAGAAGTFCSAGAGAAKDAGASGSGPIAGAGTSGTSMSGLTAMGGVCWVAGADLSSGNAGLEGNVAGTSGLTGWSGCGSSCHSANCVAGSASDRRPSSPPKSGEVAAVSAALILFRFCDALDAASSAITLARPANSTTISRTARIRLIVSPPQ